MDYHNTMKKKIATYEGKRVYVIYLSRTGHFALVSYNQDETGKFKVDINSLTDLKDAPDEGGE